MSASVGRLPLSAQHEGADMGYGLFDKDGDAVDDLFGYVSQDAANEALGEYERGGRETYDGVHVAEMCECPYGDTVHAFRPRCVAWM